MTNAWLALIYNHRNSSTNTLFLPSCVIVWYFLISLVIAAISDPVGGIWRLPRMLFHSAQSGERLAVAFFSFLFSGCVCPGRCRPVRVLRDAQGRVNIWLHRWQELWKVHTGEWPPARAGTRVIHPRNIPGQPLWFIWERERVSECVCVWVRLCVKAQQNLSVWMHCVCYVHQPFFQH